MARTGVHFVFLCFVSIAFLSLVASEYKLYNSRNRPNYAGVQHGQSSDEEKTDIHYLKKNKCKFFIVEKTIFYSCPKRPTRYPFLSNEVFRDDKGEEHHHSEKFECPFPFGTYPHETDCKKFYLCLFDKPRTMTCDSSKLYDEYKNECADKNTVDCGDRTGGITTKGTTPAPGQTTSAVKTTTKKVVKFKCPYTWGTFPHPEDCSMYYLCLNKRHNLKKCKPTENYDDEKNECRNADEVDCGSRFNPRATTTEPSTTTAATTVRPTTSVTREETTTKIFEEQTSQSSPGDTSEEGEIGSSTSMEISPSSEPKTTLTDEIESTTSEITSEEPGQSTEEPIITTDDNSQTDKPESSTEKDEITDEDASDTDQPEPSSEKPIITNQDTPDDSKEPEPTSENSKITDDITLHSESPELSSKNPKIIDYTSKSDQPEPTSEKPETTDNDIPDTKETEFTSEESLEVTETTSKPTVEDSSISEEPDITDNISTTSGKIDNTDSGQSDEPVTTAEDNLSKESQTTENVGTSETAENETPSKESEAPVDETTTSTKLRSSVPDANTGSDDENSTDGKEEETDYATEEASTPFQPESTENVGATSEEQHSPAENKISKALPFSTPSINSDNTDEMTETSAQFETTAKETITIRPEVSQTTVNIREISSSSDEVKTSLITSSKPPESFECPKKKGYFPHKDCSLFYDCRGGVYKIRQCPDGTLFHSKFSLCFNEDDVDCGDRIRPDKDESSSVTYISSASPTERPITRTTSHENISSEFSKSFENTDQTVDYSSSGISETKSTTVDNTEETDDTSYFDNSDLTTTEDTEKATSDRIQDETSVESTTDFIKDELSTQSTEGNTELQNTSEEIVREATTDLIKDETSTQSTAENDELQNTSETTEITTDFIKDNLSTQNTEGDNELQSTSETTEGKTGDSSTKDHRTSFTSETTYSDVQEEATTDYTDISIVGTYFTSETHNTDNIEETTGTTGSRTDKNEISTKNVATLASGKPPTQEGTSDLISSVRTTSGETIKDLTSSKPPISIKEKSTSLLPGTTHPNSYKPTVSEITKTESYEPSETTEDYFPGSKDSTKVPDITTASPEEIIVSTVRPKEVCLATDKTCIIDKEGNVFRCPKSHGHFPHPWDASKFLHCDNFRIHVINCPAGLRFDPKHNICTWAAATKE